MFSFCENFARLPSKTIFSQCVFAISCDRSGVLDGRCVFVLGDRLWQGSPRARSRRRIGGLLRPSCTVLRKCSRPGPPKMVKLSIEKTQKAAARIGRHRCLYM